MGGIGARIRQFLATTTSARLGELEDRRRQMVWRAVEDEIRRLRSKWAFHEMKMKSKLSCPLRSKEDEQQVWDECRQRAITEINFWDNATEDERRKFFGLSDVKRQKFIDGLITSECIE